MAKRAITRRERNDERHKEPRTSPTGTTELSDFRVNRADFHSRWPKLMTLFRDLSNLASLLPTPLAPHYVPLHSPLDLQRSL
ncbi:hypothetical protein LshimejAT787_0905780 [Lyophyllum shimeji]|uniref:Uncharacterized protein n=1 Tax=Lyophyllum shimeji TaxID=47721 RepID=A0A9P3UQ60_LYOSH|nr:hypothetical protein LshimejAT787_0905780 [Lyophyllum shimeji]